MARHARGDEKPAMADCGACHSESARNYANDAHYLKQDFRCTDCHRGIHTLQQGKKSKAAIVAKCSECHDSADYVEKGHGAAVLKGNNDSASCADCHGLHRIPAFRASAAEAGPLPAEAKLFFMPKCTCVPHRSRADEEEQPFAHGGQGVRGDLSR